MMNGFDYVLAGEMLITLMIIIEAIWVNRKLDKIYHEIKKQSR